MRASRSAAVWSKPEVRALHIGVVEELRSGARKDDPAALKHIGPIGVQQCLLHILLDEEDG